MTHDEPSHFVPASHTGGPIRFEHYVSPQSVPAVAGLSASELLSAHPYIPPDTSSAPSTSEKLITRTPASEYDALELLLISTQVDLNVFTAGPVTLGKLLDSHHIERVPNLMAGGARQALLCHLLSGACVGASASISRSKHACQCDKLFDAFSTGQAMSFAALSLLLSSSADRLPDLPVQILSKSFGWAEFSRETVLRELSLRRNSLVVQHATVHSAVTVLDSIDKLPKGTLLALSHAHGIPITKATTTENMRLSLSRHLSNKD
ncbi:hypothetical protein FB451DRAFT_1162567 [Mycena latifolia]|nr:hypothetical protein FB451DRAFT_1162567 [Mycena latifolia]